MDALHFGDRLEMFDLIVHSNVALFEQYEPRSAANDEDLSVPEDYDIENLYLVPAW